MNNDLKFDCDMLDILNEWKQHDMEMDQLCAVVATIHSTYKALQNGMSLDGIVNPEVKDIIEAGFEQYGLESLDPIHPAELMRRTFEDCGFEFAYESVFESILLWNIWGQVAFICFVPAGIVIWCLAIADRILTEAKIIEEERKKLQEEGFYSPGANADDWKGREDMNERALARYKEAKVKAYPAKQLLDELAASYDLMRTFTDSIANNTQIKPKQIVPALKRLGYIVDESTSKIHRDKEKAPKKGTMESLGYGDPSFIKHVFVKTDAHTELLPNFIKAMEKIKQQQADQNSVTEKIKRFFKVGSKEEIKSQDKLTANLISNALQATLTETEVLFKMSIQLMSVLKKFN